MSHKQKLAKLALSAFLVSAASANAGQVIDLAGEKVTLMAAGCGSCGKKIIADNYGDSYPTRHMTYGNNDPDYTNNSGYNRSSAAVGSYPTGTGYNDNSDGNTSGYHDSRRMNSDLSRSRNTNEAYGNIDETYNDTYNNQAMRQNSGGMAATTSSSLTEPQLLAQLTPQGRAIYMSLDAEGKALAIQLASEESYRDKNLAVKEAQRRVNERRGLLSR